MNSPHRPFRRPLAILFAIPLALGVSLSAGGDEREDRFAQLREELPSPSSYRTASGAPGHEYWQQKVDYRIEVELDDEAQALRGSERIRYQNNSPDALRYLWLQVEPNYFAPQSHAVATTLAPNLDAGMTFEATRALIERQVFDGGAKISNLVDSGGAPLEFALVDTTMRVDLPAPLLAGQAFEFSLDWAYSINDQRKFGGRSGYEFFEEDGNYLYEMAHWFPRMCAYTDYTGWQNKEFLGRGEFTLEFGDYEVSITVPDDHVVASTGVLQNPEDVLEPLWMERLALAETADEPVLVITREEAEANESTAPTGKKTWTFAAENVRDFAWASSRKFIWDAKLHEIEGGDPVWAMSYWPKEGHELWLPYSTHSVIHTLDVYGKYTFPYPYPVAISVNGPVGGMEYPMICFNGPRPAKDGTYTARSKYGLISVIIHEVGHNWFPMIVNSDERQWTWMDEGLNTYVQFLAESEWEEDYPSRRGAPGKMTGYMTSTAQVPIMTNSESILQFGNNAYGKPATALNILRETVVGRELFDFAFKEYSRRWMFKRPEPADLFRTLEDASGVDLDWFWRGWFYTTDHVDISLDAIYQLRLDTKDPDIDFTRRREEDADKPTKVGVRLNEEAGTKTWVDRHPDIKDFYDENDIFTVTNKERNEYKKFLEGLKDWERTAFERAVKEDKNYYVLEFSNIGGLVMPIILELELSNGKKERIHIPAEIWRRNPKEVRKLIVLEKGTELTSVIIDPDWETADANIENNHYPRRMIPSRLESYKSKRSGLSNRDIMKDSKTKLKKDEKKDKDGKNE